MTRFDRITIVALGCFFVLTTSVSAENWTRFRGTNGEGKSELRGVPAQWKESDYEWVIELPGKGHSSPAVWENLLFISTGDADGTRTLHCLDATTGKSIWKDSIQLEANHLHKKNSYASGTPATDGKLVYVTFADEKKYTLLAYDMKGERQWTRDFGRGDYKYSIVVPECPAIESHIKIY